jgi:hypothetical protein
MYIRRLLYSSPGKYAISIILGLGLATLFRKVCKERGCLVFHAPSINKVKDQVFRFGDKCYTFKEKAERCDDTKKILRFA